MAKIKRFGEENKNRKVNINFLTEILDSVKEYLPSSLKYIKILNKRVGYQQGSLELTFYDDKWKNINKLIEADFNDMEQERYGGEACLSDYIHNSLTGMNQNTDEIDWTHSDEFFEKVGLDDEVYYEYPNN